MKRIKIFDTTLRDGEQSPGCSMNLAEKLDMARQLDAITALQFDRLNEMLVVKGLNDPAHCYLE